MQSLHASSGALTSTVYAPQTLANLVCVPSFLFCGKRKSVDVVLLALGALVRRRSRNRTGTRHMNWETCKTRCINAPSLSRTVWERLWMPCLITSSDSPTYKCMVR